MAPKSVRSWPPPITRAATSASRYGQPIVILHGLAEGGRARHPRRPNVGRPHGNARGGGTSRPGGQPGPARIGGRGRQRTRKRTAGDYFRSWLVVFGERGMFTEHDKAEFTGRGRNVRRLDLAGGSHDSHLDALDQSTAPGSPGLKATVRSGQPAPMSSPLRGVFRCRSAGDQGRTRIRTGRRSPALPLGLHRVMTP